MRTIPIDSTDAREQREAEAEAAELELADRRDHAERCRRGWLGEDAGGRPIPCPVCKGHLATVPCWTCNSSAAACRSQAAARRGRCCDGCDHRVRRAASREERP